MAHLSLFDELLLERADFSAFGRHVVSQDGIILII